MRSSKHVWDAFRSKPQKFREARQNTNYHIYLLHCLRLFIYFVGHALIVVGAFISKLSVLILATNLSNQKPPVESYFHITCSVVEPPNRSFRENEYTIFAALYIIQTFPDIFAIFQSGYHFLKQEKYDFSISKSLIFFETLRTGGLSCFFFFLFPDLELPRCVLILCGTAFMPYFAKVVNRFLQSLDYSQRLLRRLGNLFKNLPRTVVLSILLSSMYLWSAMNVPFKHICILPTAMITVGIGNWEIWIKPHHAGSKFNQLFKFKYGLCKISTFNRIVTSIFRIGSVSFVIFWSMFERKMFLTDFAQLLIHRSIASENIHILILAFFVLCANFFIRCCARFLAAMRMRMLKALHPAVLLTPLLFIFFYLTAHSVPLCMINFLLRPFGLNWHCYRWHLVIEPCSDYYVTLVWLICYVVWSYSYVKGQQPGKMDEIIESMPIALNGLAIENCLVILRYVVGKKEFIEDLDDEPYTDKRRIFNSEIDRTMTLYVCATMWHETRNEMIQMVKSILKLDEEHAVRLAEKSRNMIRFRLEVHIFFDDVWVNDKECGRIPNSYFELLFELLMELMSNSDASTKTCVLVSASYGGRLVVRLPAGTLLFVHLKDKLLVRHKKRWSQVMYMYYLLGHRIMDSHLSVEDQQLQADNTYILAIDGDSKFEPEAVVKLLHLMNTKSDIGCACGRIHPIGDGIMVWYQKFEYAIAHWFQKAAEHVFGCVLCAPGCFSLFRASAIMDDNIMHKYTKTAEEPRHYVQYDQGEDRWLSTLMLKQGYRIEYAAGADAETYAPEGFEEFYNQRRRWTPSSVANTLDLLFDYKLASQNNDSISITYIIYQMLVISFSLLGPAIIFTMLVYAQVAAFGMHSSYVLVYNAIPVCFFIFCCFCMDSNVQLFFAKIASIVYAFIMLAVMIATAQQIVLETVFSPTSVYVLLMIIIFLFAAMIHPKEFKNILFGAVFFLMIPSTYVFLSLYSLVNLNVINWGTREAVAKATGVKTNSDEVVGEKWIKRLGLDNENSSAYKLLPWLKPAVPEHNENLRALERKVERTEALLKNLQGGPTHHVSQQYGDFSRLHIISEEQRQKGFGNIDRFEAKAARTIENVHSYGNPMAGKFKDMWMECEYLQHCDRGRLKQSEERFWNQLIEKYLRPIETTPQEQKVIAKGLAELRNSVAFTIIILNGLLVLAIFLLQRHKDVLSIRMIPYEGFQWTKMNETTGKFEKTKEALKVDPLGMSIITFLLGILIVQTVGMIIHRLNTLVEALHEVTDIDDISFETSELKSKMAILNEARAMIDTLRYHNAHGSDGYVREGKMENKALNNVLYKLQKADDSKLITRRVRLV